MHNSEAVIRCFECDTRAPIRSLDEADEKVERHNKRRHDGDDVAIAVETPPPLHEPLHDHDRESCNRCGEPYDSYMVAIRDNISDMVSFLSEDYDGMCKACRAAITPGCAYSGAADVDPKISVEGT